MTELGWASGLSDPTACSLCCPPEHELTCWAPLGSRNWAGKSESIILMKGEEEGLCASFRHQEAPPHKHEGGPDSPPEEAEVACGTQASSQPLPLLPVESERLQQG